MSQKSESTESTVPATARKSFDFTKIMAAAKELETKIEAVKTSQFEDLVVPGLGTFKYSVLVGQSGAPRPRLHLYGEQGQLICSISRNLEGQRSFSPAENLRVVTIEQDAQGRPRARKQNKFDESLYPVDKQDQLKVVVAAIVAEYGEDIIPYTNDVYDEQEHPKVTTGKTVQATGTDALAAKI